MGYGIRLTVWGKYACFTRPEFEAERVSFDVMTPSAARGILEAIHWKPAIKYVIDKIQVNNPIKMTNIKRNELGEKVSLRKIKSVMKEEYDSGIILSDEPLYIDVTSGKNREQRNSLILKDVSYTIEAHFEMTPKAGERDTPEKHYNMIIRRIKNGQCSRQPYLGTREFTAHFQWADEMPESFYKGQTLDLSWMLYDKDYSNNKNPVYFRAIMKDGIIVPKEGLR